MTRKEMVKKLVEADVNDIKEMVTRERYDQLTAWLSPMLSRSYDPLSDAEVEKELVAKGLHSTDEKWFDSFVNNKDGDN